MLKLPSVITNVIHSENKADSYDLEVRNVHVDNSLPEADGANLSNLVKTAISYFHGPQVEGSFSVMKQVLNTQTARLDVSTYRAIQSIKYPLRAAGKTAVQYLEK